MELGEVAQQQPINACLNVVRALTPDRLEVTNKMADALPLVGVHMSCLRARGLDDARKELRIRVRVVAIAMRFGNI